VLHSIAGSYPERPSEEEQRRIRAFIDTIALIYPCTICAQDFQDTIKASPPRVQSREELSVWMCEQHNEVNAKLGKPRFPCSFRLLDERWGAGSEECTGELLELDELNNELIMYFR